MRHVHVLGELRLLLGLPLLLREDAIPRQLEHLLRGLEEQPTHDAAADSAAAADSSADSATDSSADSATDSATDAAADDRADVPLMSDRLRGRLPEHRVGGRPLLPRIVDRER